MSGLTEAQERAVRALSGNVAISAGAGSGKTRVIAHRFARAMSDPALGAGIDIDAILTITFTSKAAGEISERIRRVLTEEGQHAIARRIDEAWISTIHGLCSRLVRRHALEAGVSPRFQVADDVVVGLLRSEAWELTARDAVARDADSAALFQAMGHRVVRDSVLRVIEHVRAMGVLPSDLTVSFGSVEDAMAVVAETLEQLASAIEAAPSTEARAASIQTLRAYAARLRAGDDDAARELVYSRKPWKNESRHGIDGSEAQTAIDRLRACIGEADHAWIPASFLGVLSAFDRQYAAIKRQREILDFDDLQENAVRLLADERVARLYRSAFRLVMVDEFQDTNELQMRVIDRLSENNLCVVGDDKQSIYGWRYADVGVFTRCRDRAQVCEQLDTNFRSHPQILEFTNELFTRAPFWNDYMRLRAGRTDPPTVPWPAEEPRVEVMVVEKGECSAGDAAFAEASAVAARIAALVRDGVDPGGIAILLRSSTYADLFAAALADQGVEVLQSAGGSFFDAPEIADLRALLRATVLPHDDEALARVLAGDLTGVSVNGLWRVRRAAPAPAALWNGVCALIAEGCAGLTEEDAGRLVSAHEAIERLRAGAKRWGLDELLRRAVDDFDYDLILLARGIAGRTAWANVLKLIRIATVYQQVETGDPLAFERYLERREEYSTREAQGATTASGTSAVRIMTVHAAKGLEFPVVVVPDLGRGVRVAADGRFLVGPVSQDGTVPLGFRLPDASGGFTQDSTERARISAAHAAQALAEEKRVFYVACTRAEEALILSGTEGSGESRLSWVTDNMTPVADAPDRASIGPLVVRLRRIDGARSERGANGPRRVRPGQRPPSIPPVDSARLERARSVLALGETRNQSDRSPAMPLSVSYSSLHDYTVCHRRFFVKHVIGLRDEGIGRRADATRFGSAVHSALERVGSGRLDNTILDAVTRGYELTSEERARLSTMVAAYNESAVAAEVRGADRVLREQPFAIELEGTSLEGSIDVIAWKGSDALIIDYKTGKSALGPSGVDAYRAQAECYALAAFSAGATAVRAVFLRLECPDESHEFDFAPSQREALTSKIQGIVDDMAAGHYEPLDRYRREVCGDCPASRGLCDLHQPDGDRDSSS